MATNPLTMSSLLPTSAAFDDLFKDRGGSAAYLDSLTRSAKIGTPEAGVSQARATSDSSMSDPAYVASLAKQNGWADPNAFNLDMITAPDMSVTHGEGGSRYTNPWVQFKDPESRGITNTGRNLNRVQVMYDDQGQNYGTEGSPVSGYKVLAGAVPGTKNHTSLFYQYDKDGKFQGANFDMEERGLEGAAPLVNMALMAMGAGGALGSVGSSINSSLGLGLGNVGQAALGGAAVGGGTAALTGQNPLKGAAMGGMGAAVAAANPAGAMGITDPKLLRVLNTGASNLAKSVISGQDPKDVIVNTALGAAVPTMSTLMNIAKR